jgi:type III pantothenate kinase
MSARAMHEFTDLLPLVDAAEFVDAPPPALGTDTESAMQSGLFWGAIGSIRQIIEELCKAATSGRVQSTASWGGSLTATPSEVGSPPHIFLTGGAGPTVAQLLGPDAHYIPHLTLAGIAAAAVQRAP